MIQNYFPGIFGAELSFPHIREDFWKSKLARKFLDL
jgi:hypothetical protein